MEFSFFFPTNKTGHHVLGCLMQGLLQLGHKVYSNIPVKKIWSNGICPPFSSLYCDEVEITSDLSKGHLIVDAFDGLGPFTQSLSDSAKRNKIVLVNMNDTVNWVDYDDNFLVFAGHFNKLAQRNGRIFPIGFGISQEAIELSNQYELAERVDGILRNFRPSSSQSVRNSLDLSLIPKLTKYFSITDRISSPEQYIQDLTTHKACLSYCGEFYRDLRLNPWFLENTKDNSLSFKKIANEPIILRFDSWRYYEGALFGACPITLDFEKYGLDTSANPRAWKEYIPINLSELEATVLKLTSAVNDDPMYFENIGSHARGWVLKNHSPKAVAQRMLDTMQVEGFL